MNDKQKESAARHLCKLRGIDPDTLIGHGAEPNKDGFTPAVWLQSPAWRLALPEIEAALQVQEAIAIAKQEKQG